MANTFTLLAKTVLGSDTNVVTFSGIPSTFEDLCVRWSARSSSGTYADIQIVYSGDTATSSYSRTWMAGADGVSTGSGRYPTNTIGSFEVNAVSNGSATTASTFSNAELYLPNYASSIYKPATVTSVMESNSNTVNDLRHNGLLYNTTTAVSSLTFNAVGNNFVTGSSFYLYGIKNS